MHNINDITNNDIASNIIQICWYLLPAKSIKICIYDIILLLLNVHVCAANNVL